MQELTTYAPACPRSSVALGAHGCPDARRVSHVRRATGRLRRGWLAIVVLLVAAKFVLSSAAIARVLFDGAFVVDGFGRFMKLLMLGGAVLRSAHVVRRLRAAPSCCRVRISRADAACGARHDADGLGQQTSSRSTSASSCRASRSTSSPPSTATTCARAKRASSISCWARCRPACCSTAPRCIYGFTGSTELRGDRRGGAEAGATATNIGLIFGLVFLLVGLAFKISAVPFHMWTPDVYRGRADAGHGVLRRRAEARRHGAADALHC